MAFGVVAHTKLEALTRNAKRKGKRLGQGWFDWAVVGGCRVGFGEWRPCGVLPPVAKARGHRSRAGIGGCVGVAVVGRRPILFQVNL
jgi:hypothetical protein